MFSTVSRANGMICLRKILRDKTYNVKEFRGNKI